MRDMEEKISALLSSPDAMEKIMSMARSLGLGGASSGGASGAPSDRAAPAPEATAPVAPEFDVGSLDPKLLGAVSRVMGEYSRADDRKGALLAALKPFLKPERAEKVDRAIQIARLSRVIKAAYHGLKGGEESV